MLSSPFLSTSQIEFKVTDLFRAKSANIIINLMIKMKHLWGLVSSHLIFLHRNSAINQQNNTILVMTTSITKQLYKLKLNK